MSMHIHVLTLFPNLIKGYLQEGLLSQAISKQILEVNTINPRDFVTDVHRTVDDRPYSGSDGMVMLAEPLKLALHSIPKTGPVFYLSPQGQTWSQKKARHLAQLPDFTLICGRYGGLDQRFINAFVDEEISIGDYVLSGGELASLVVIESVSRFCPGVLGHRFSADRDSFENGFLEAPQFTRPRRWEDQEVPGILTSGHHALISQWQENVSALITLQKRPDLAPLCGPLARQRVKELILFWGQISVAERRSLGLKEQVIDLVLESLSKEFSL